MRRRTKMKKISVKIIVATLFATLLIACGNSDDADKNETADNGASQQNIISENDEFRLIKMEKYDGSVEVERSGSGIMSAIEGMQLISNDKVKVGETSLVELLIDSDKHVAAEENTIFRITADGDSEAGNVSIKLVSGNALFTIDNKLSDESTFTVNTPNATLSVRGTIFSVIYSPELETTSVFVEEGTVEVAHGDETDMVTADDGQLEIIGECDYSDSDFSGFSSIEKYSKSLDMRTSESVGYYIVKDYSLKEGYSLRGRSAIGDNPIFSEIYDSDYNMIGCIWFTRRSVTMEDYFIGLRSSMGETGADVVVYDLYDETTDNYYLRLIKYVNETTGAVTYYKLAAQYCGEDDGYGWYANIEMNISNDEDVEAYASNVKFLMNNVISNPLNFEREPGVE